GGWNPVTEDPLTRTPGSRAVPRRVRSRNPWRRSLRRAGTGNGRSVARHRPRVRSPSLGSFLVRRAAPWSVERPRDHDLQRGFSVMLSLFLILVASFVLSLALTPLARALARWWRL